MIRSISVRRWQWMVVLCATVGAAPMTLAEIRLQTRNDFALGGGPSAFTFVGPGTDLLVVATADGLATFRREGRQFVRAERSPAGRGAEALAAGTFRGTGSPQLAYGGRDAPRMLVADIDAQGSIGSPKELALPALPRVARSAVLDAGRAALIVATDEGVSVLSQGTDGWTRQEIAASRSITDIASGDLSGHARVDVVAVDAGLHQLRVFHGAAGGFTAGPTISTMRGPRRVVLADTGGDGRLDLLVLGDEGLAVHVAQPDGGFAPPQVLLAGPQFADIGTADLNGDGRLDLTLVDRGRAVVSVLVGSGAGRFAVTESYLVGGGPTALQLGDMDGDGRIDALTLNQFDDSATLLRGSGDGRFDGVRAVVTELGALVGVAIDDFDRNDHPDLAAVSEDGGQVGVFLGRGDGSFRALPPIAIGRQPRAVVSGDFNQDERPDLAVVNFGNDAVTILDGDGQGGFAARRAVRVGTGPSAISVGSFASPTSSDLAVVNSLSDSVSVLYGDGRGQFPTVANFPVTPRPSFMIVGDTNRDGHQDLVVGSEFSESVAILLGTGRQLDAPKTNTLSAVAKPSVAEDLDGDGEMDLINPNQSSGAIEVLPGSAPGKFGAPLRVEVGRDPRAVASGDFNHDGRADIAVAHGATRTITILLNQSTPPKTPRKADQRAATRSRPHS
jgi:hypothetical protein